MEFKLNKPIASNAGSMDENDIINVKRALNRLGYYTPMKETGITSISDREMFDALKAFQSDKDLSPTGEMRPDDETYVELVGEEKKKKKYKIQYEWRTVGDNKVRRSHAAPEGDVRFVGEGIQPGDEPGCRCWMVNVKRVRDCSEEKAAYLEAKKKFEELHVKKNEIENELRDLLQAQQKIVKKVQGIFGGNAAIEGLPTKKIVGEIITEIVGNIVQDESQNRLKKYGKKKRELERRIFYLEGELKLVRSMLLKAEKDVVQKLEELEECLAEANPG